MCRSNREVRPLLGFHGLGVVGLRTHDGRVTHTEFSRERGASQYRADVRWLRRPLPTHDARPVVSDSGAGVPLQRTDATPRTLTGFSGEK